MSEMPSSLAPLVLACALAASACGSSPPPAAAAPPPSATGAREGTVPSADGVSIHYASVGAGDSAVVLVHCWSCNAHYWDGQVKALTPKWRVVTLDLAGHGASGKSRATWTMTSFGEDVRAVVTALGLKRVVLVGHSMAGPVILEATRLMPDRVVGLVPVDTLHDVEREMPDDKKEALFARMRQDFPGTTGELVRKLLPSGTNPALVDRLLTDETGADPAVAVPVFQALFQYKEAPALDAIKVPIRAIDTDLVPMNLEANRRHAPQFEVVLMKGVGHWPMLERPEEFNAKLVEVLAGMPL